MKNDSPCDEWNESLGHGVHRVVRTLQQHAHTMQCTRSPTEVTASFHRHIKASSCFYWQHLVIFQREILCGMAAMLLMIPETIAFSYAANLDPLNGLYATGFLGMTVSLFGGVPATVAGAAGAVAMVIPTITSSTGSLAYLTYKERLEHLFVAVTIAGILELLFGLLKLSKLFSMIPRTAHIGFLNGLALMMFLSQKTTMEVCKYETMNFGECEIAGDLKWMSVSSPTTWITVGLILLTMAIMHFFPRTPYIGHLIPPTLVAAAIGVGFEFAINRPLLGYDLRTIGDTSPLNGGLPAFNVPKFDDVQDWGVVLSTAASIMAIGLFESLMTLQSVVDLKKEQLSQRATRKECIAQGIGNILCGVFSGMGGCSMIAQSNGNVLNGALYRLSSFMGGVFTFLVVFFASSLIEKVPVACLTGILFRDRHSYILLAVSEAHFSLIVGVIWQCLVNGWQSGRQLTFHTGMEVVPVASAHADHEVLMNCEEAKVYYLKGQLLFSSVTFFREFFDVLYDPRIVILDMGDCVFVDFSAVAAFREVTGRYRDAGKTLVARNLDLQSLNMLNHDFGWVSVAHIQNATSELATNTDELLMSKIDKERSSCHSHAFQGSVH
ncbi:unnamed protein product [Peronospora belbahrii]|uniref:STAS domain-containing protein n=2 Tax=Peronospora belbahrii TaxID=622444 RepID=A0AAU9L4C6_9STRA|nr:unnamed protein product [Peronospora belbahrii]